MKWKDKLMRKLGFLVVFAVVVLVLQGCGSTAKPVVEKDTRKTVTVTTSFLRDMVTQLAGDVVHIEEIIPAGEDPHLYVAKPQDVTKVKQADLVLYHGLHFEGKMQDVLEKKGVAVSSTFPKGRIGTMEEDGAMIVDPHFWFDIDLYKEAVHNAAVALIDMDGTLKERVTKEEARYLKELDALAERSKTKLASIPEQQRYLITPHDAFNYFSRYFKMYVMAPQGVSTDSEVANKDLDNTVNFIVEHNVKAIFAESTTDPARMKKLQEAAAARGFHVEVVSGHNKELFSDSLAPKGEPGDTYITMFDHNIDLIVKHLQ